MHITQHTDFALRVLIYLATQEERLPTIQEIAERFDISRNHLMKVVNGLIRFGYVEGIRGKGGGLRLARGPADISVGEVLRRMEGDPVLVECFSDQSQCLLTGRCRLQTVLKRALAAFFAVLDPITLDELRGPTQQQVLRFIRQAVPPA